MPARWDKFGGRLHFRPSRPICLSEQPGLHGRLSDFAPLHFVLGHRRRAGRHAARRLVFHPSATPSGRLGDPEAIGGIAAERAVARLGGRKVKTGEFPIILEAPLAGGLLGSLVHAASGGALYRKSSFLLDQLGKKSCRTSFRRWSARL